MFLVQGPIDLTIKVEKVAGANSVLSGIFLDNPLEVDKTVIRGDTVVHSLYIEIPYEREIRATVENLWTEEDLEDVLVYDRFGAEFRIDCITIDCIPYEFDYVEYVPGGEVTVTGLDSSFVSGKLDKNGVTFRPDNCFHVYWTGNSIKAHFEWTIGTLPAETRTIFIGVSTDKTRLVSQSSHRGIHIT